MNSPAAYQNWWRDGGKNVLENIKTTADKTVDFVVVDLKGASKEQIRAMKAYVKTLTTKQRNKIIYVR